jgi:hypothetical protein
MDAAGEWHLPPFVLLGPFAGGMSLAALAASLGHRVRRRGERRAERMEAHGAPPGDAPTRHHEAPTDGPGAWGG